MPEQWPAKRDVSAEKAAYLYRTPVRDMSDERREGDIAAALNMLQREIDELSGTAKELGNCIEGVLLPGSMADLRASPAVDADPTDGMSPVARTIYYQIVRVRTLTAVITDMIQRTQL